MPDQSDARIEWRPLEPLIHRQVSGNGVLVAVDALRSEWEKYWAEFDEKAYAKVLGDAWKGGKGVRIWNPAYVQNQNYRTDLPTKHERYLALVKYMMDDQVADRLQSSQTYEQAYRILRNYPLHGQRFLPMQHLTDINYSPVLNFDEDDFITPGDGAMRGVQKCFGRRVSVSEAQGIIYNFVDEQEVYFKRLGCEPVTLFGCRRLHAIDIQNLFCEVDKYSRVAHPEFKVKDGERLKQSLNPASPLPVPILPLGSARVKLSLSPRWAGALAWGGVGALFALGLAAMPVVQKPFIYFQF